MCRFSDVRKEILCNKKNTDYLHIPHSIYLLIRRMDFREKRQMFEHSGQIFIFNYWQFINYCWCKYCALCYKCNKRNENLFVFLFLSYFITYIRGFYFIKWTFYLLWWFIHLLFVFIKGQLAREITGSLHLEK